MHKQDVIPIHYFESPDRFADLINGYVYHGEERIRPENVREKSSSVARIAPKKKGGKEIQTQVITADIVREVGGDMRVSVVALESQTDIHYAMPVRVMNLEGAHYHKQWRAAKKRHRQEKDLSGAEFLSGYGKDDKLIPMVTIVLYWGKTPWDGPVCLKDMMDLEAYPEELREMIADYPIHLLEVRKYQRIEEFRTDLQQVFGFLQLENNKEALKLYVNRHEEVFRNLSDDAYDMISVMTHSDELMECRDDFEQEDRGDMCQAIKEMIEDGRQEGRLEGRQEGIKAFIELCQELGISKEDTLRKLQEKFTFVEPAKVCLEKYWK